jgi:hypothetical protein
MLTGLQEITSVELQPCLDRIQRQSFPQIQGGPQMTGSAVRSISGSAVQGELNVRITRQRAGPPHPSSSRLSQGFTSTTYLAVAREAVEGQTCLASQSSPRPQRFTLESPDAWRSHPARMPLGPQVSRLSVGFIPAEARLAATCESNANRVRSRARLVEHTNSNRDRNG